MTPISSFRLRALAEKATPGPWYAQEVTKDGRTIVDDGRSSWSNDIQCETPDALYIAAASPDVVLSLLDMIEQARREQDEAREHWGETSKLCKMAEQRAERAERAVECARKALREIDGFFNPLNYAATSRADTAKAALREIDAIMAGEKANG